MTELTLAVADVARAIGPEAAMEATAQCLDIIANHAGQVLRDAFTLAVQLANRQALAAAIAHAAITSGAEHELAYYGGAA